MDIDALKTFIEVNRTRHFGQAARNLHLSQSTVSARIKLLEEQIGMPLFVRKRNDIQLTHAGEKLLHYAESMVTTWIRARQEIAIVDQSLIPFVVGSTQSLWDSVLQNWMKYLISKQPDTVLHIEVQDAEVLARRVHDRTMDIAFVFDHPQQFDLVCKEVTETSMILVSSQAGLKADDAIRDRYVLVEWGSSFSITHARHFPDMPQPRVRVMLGRIALDYILTNGGHAYMPEAMVKEYLDNGELFLVEDAPLIKRSVYAMYSAENPNQQLVKTACEFFLAK